MNDLYDFYDSILNIEKGSQGQYFIIGKIVLEETERLRSETSSLAGFCKILASQIEERLRELNIRTHYIDLKDLVGVDHVILISEYQEEQKTKRVLIDPTFEQFVKKEDEKLLSLEEWPSEKIVQWEMVDSLITKGIVDINNDSFSDYINSFSREPISISLSQYLLDSRLNSITRK